MIIANIHLTELQTDVVQYNLASISFIWDKLKGYIDTFPPCCLWFYVSMEWGIYKSDFDFIIYYSNTSSTEVCQFRDIWLMRKKEKGIISQLFN